MVVWTSYSFHIFINNMQRYNRRSNRLAIKLNLGYSSYFILLVLVCLCYISIFIKVRGSRQHQLHGVAGLRERKLTSTSFLVTFCIIINLSTRSYLGKYVFPSFHVRSKLVHLYSNCWHCTNIILGQLANKSYSLCSADARI